MTLFDSRPLWTRRQALRNGARLTGGLLAASTLGSSLAWADRGDKGGDHDGDSDDSTVPSATDRQNIEDILEAKGMVSDGIFTIEIDRDDIDNVTLHGVSIKPSFQINGTICFQTIGGGRLMLNADIPLKPTELDPFIRQLIRHDIVFQAEHQHFYDFTPMVWFVHYRGTGDATTLARSIKAALDVTSTPFPQAPPANPSTPLPADTIGKILGASPQIGADGVVTYDLPRREPLRLGGIHINPYLNAETNIAFQPWGGGRNAAAAPDFGMMASETNNVVGLMQKQGWDIGCLYNQETDEQPQLYFSHQFKTGDSIELAKEIRRGLDLMNLKFE